jgi:hypothetical protein
VDCFPPELSGSEPRLYKHVSSGAPTLKYQLELGCAIFQAVSGLLPNAAARIRSPFINAYIIWLPDRDVEIAVRPCHSSGS